MATVRVGVLALQGGYDAHVNILMRLGADIFLIRKPEQLNKIDGLIIPGGESTALLKLMAPWHFLEALQRFHQQGKFLFGTCAGCILLAKTVEPEQTSLGLIDLHVKRNAYGRQVDSFTTTLSFANPTPSAVEAAPVPAVFIRAPKITAIGPAVTPLIYEGDEIVMARQGRVLVATFHPELTKQTTIHQYCLQAL